MDSTNSKAIHWALFIALSVIWGSSFILMKEGMKALTAYQVAAMRILGGGLLLIPVAIRHIRNIPRAKFSYIILSGLLGSFLPAFLFCIAETKIDSSLAAFLNSLTSVFTIVVGVIFFQSAIQRGKVIGVIIAFTGMLMLLFSKGTLNLQYFSFAGFVLLATLCYAVNVNMVNRYLKEVGSVKLAAISLSALTIPSLLILFFSGYFSLPAEQNVFWYSTGASALLGIVGTAVATILFYMLLKKAGPLFASMVTYGIPFVALLWGLIAGEQINVWEIIALGIILFGVYRSNR